MSSRSTLRHVGALARDRLHQALLVEGDERLAHRQPADAELLGDRVLVDALARLEPAREDRVADVGGDVLGEVAATTGPDVDRFGRHDSSIHVVLRSVNLSMACSDLSLPNPDCFTPPNGTVRSPSS